MKRQLFALLFLVVSSSPAAFSQFELGLQAGMHSLDLTSGAIAFPGTSENNSLDFKEARYGFQFGLYTRLSLLGVFVQPSFMLNSTSVDYTLDGSDEGGPITTAVNERYNKLDIPVVVGFKLAAIRLYGGPVAHLHINSSSDLFKFRGYGQKFKNANYGFRAGAGVDLWKLRLDVSYEGNLSKFGDHITIDGQELSFDDSASRLLMTVGIKL